MPFLIFFFLLSLPVLEVASIVEVSRWVGPVATFLLLAASVTFGAFLIRSQSLLVGRRVMEAMRAGARPEQPLLDSGTVMMAGVLFMIPGFFTDVLALFLLIPSARRLIWQGASWSMRGRTRTWRTEVRPEPENPPHARRADDVIDVEYTEVPRDQGRGGTSAERDSPWSKS